MVERSLNRYTYIYHFLTWLSGNQRIHFGPTCKVPDLFQRRDQIYLQLKEQKMRWFIPPPTHYHDIFDAARQIHKLEYQIGYRFKNKLIGMEALKISGPEYAIYFNGTVHPVRHSKRIALLGDRALSMALCELWFYTSHTRKQYSSMEEGIVTRVKLAQTGRKLGIQHLILQAVGLTTSSNNIAETFEAVIGAVYVDSGNDLEEVKNVIRKIGLDKHEYLQGTGKAE